MMLYLELKLPCLTTMSSNTAVKVFTFGIGFSTALMMFLISFASENQKNGIASGANKDPAALSLAIGDKTIANGVAANDSLSTFRLAIRSACLEGILKSKGPYVLFAPTNKAFAALPKGTINKLLLPKNKDLLVQILKYHIVPSQYPFDKDPTSESFKLRTLQGGNVQISAYKDCYRDAKGNCMEAPHSVEISLPFTYQINGFEYLLGDSFNSPYINGVILFVDNVLIPPGVNISTK
jgi:uncharacterized surface protein with fasciclin (FAS1) repeats